MSTSEENDKFVILTASLKGSEPVRRRVRKDVIQSESSFLKEYIDDGATEIKIPLKRPKNLNLILKYLYEGHLTVSMENHLESLWNDARILGLVNLQNVCIQRLTDTISLDSWIQRLDFSQADGCHELEGNVLSFVNDNFESCSSSSSFTSLNVDQMVQVLHLPTVKTTLTESNRIALILQWAKANEVHRCSQTHFLLEQVDLMNFTESTLRSYFDEESALRSWRSVAIFERAIRLKKIQEEARQSIHSQADESEPIEADPAAFESMDNRLINIKQEVASEESSDAEVNASNETTNPEDSVRECRNRIKREVSPSVPSSVGETVETAANNDDGLPPTKMPRLEYSHYEIQSSMPSQPSQTDFVSKQKQILYFSQLSNGTPSLNFVIISDGSISRPQQVLTSLPKYILRENPKLLWVQEARNVCFLGHFNPNFRKVPFFHYMSGEGDPKVTLLPKMLHKRHHHYHPVILNRRLYVFGGSKSLSYKNKDRFYSAEVLDMTTAPMSKWQWQPITSMATRRDLYAAACVEGTIYVTGGAIDRPTETEPLITDHTLCYVPAEDQWKQLQPMKNFRCGHVLAVLGYKIYVFGGSGKSCNDSSKDHVNMKSAEVYDVHTNMWTLIAPMLRPRYGGSAVEIEGKIYVIGGEQSNKGESPSSVECYDPVSNSWTLVSQSVDDQGLFDSIAVIDDPECFLKGC